MTPEKTVALVTGASSVIGAATARRPVAEDAVVALVARRRDRLAELAAEIGTRDRRVAVNEMLVPAGEQTW